MNIRYPIYEGVYRILTQNPANIKMMLIKQIGSFLNPFKEL